MHDLPSQNISQTHNVNTVAACMLAFDVENSITFLAILTVESL